jgi:nucleotide-binding universal stress UspA family protein
MKEIDVTAAGPANLTTGPATERPGRRPVVLATLSVRFDPSAERFAVDCALEASAALVVVNVLSLKPCPCTMRLLGPSAATLPDEEDLEPVRASARRAAALGIPTQLLRVTSSRPVRALLEIAAERDACLLVFGPDASRIRARKLRKVTAQLRERAPCLVWTPFPDGDEPDARRGPVDARAPRALGPRARQD